MNNRLTLISALLLALCSCSHFGGNPPHPSKEDALHFISVIPDHRIFPGSREMFTEDYYRSLSRAWDVPSDAIGEIGSDEWLYYFITGNGDCDDFRIEDINITSKGRHATIRFVAYQCQRADTHQIDLQYNKGKWLIADYDATLSELEHYTKTQTQYFQSKEWQAYLDRMLADPEWSKVATAKAEEVKAFLDKPANKNHN